MSLYSEIRDQPACLQRLLLTQKDAVTEIARVVGRKSARFIYVAARGTSENAARYANYVWGAMNRMPVALAAPSLFTYYDRAPNLNSAFVVGISQSGRSPDIVSVLAEGKKQGCLTLAITNATDSPLARAADFVLNIEAGQENAVAATKTYNTELMAIAMLSAAMSGEEDRWSELQGVPQWVESVISEDNWLGTSILEYRSMSSCVVLGRGFNYATAYEWALKLKELAHVEAQPYSSADFLHGPITMVDGGFPILAVIPSGAVYAPMMEVLRRLRDGRAAELVVISDQEEAMKLAQTSLPLPCGIPEWLSPLVSIVPAQLFCYQLAIARGYDTESSHGIHKVTETR